MASNQARFPKRGWMPYKFNLLPRKCSVIKFCCRELSCQQITSRQQVKFMCLLESSQQQVACCQESSSQQNFVVEDFLSNRIFWLGTRQSNMVVSLFLEILPGYWLKKLLPRKCSSTSCLLLRKFSQQNFMTENFLGNNIRQTAMELLRLQP